jgi:hypothetical protein
MCDGAEEVFPQLRGHRIEALRIIQLDGSCARSSTEA